MASRTVEVSVASLSGIPLEVMVLAAVYTVGPLLVALAVFYAARRVSRALRSAALGLARRALHHHRADADGAPVGVEGQRAGRGLRGGA